VLGDRAVELDALLGHQARLELAGEDPQLARSGRARLLGAGEGVPGAGEGDEARAATVAVRREHRADAALAVAVGADDDLVAADALEHRHPRALRQAVDREAEVVERRALHLLTHCIPGRRRRQAFSSSERVLA
jgi:hypothetical protein